MNNLTSLINANSTMVHSSKDNKVSSSKIDSKLNSKDFISILFAQIQTNLKKPLKTNIKIPSAISTPSKNIPKDDIQKDGKSKSSSELLLGEILNIITQLKNGDDKTNFPKFSDKMDKILVEKETISDFKNVKNIDGLLKLSKKYNLGLKDIKFTQENIRNLKKDFPKLDIEKFFESKNNRTNDIFKKNIFPSKSNRSVVIEQIIKDLPDKKSKNLPKNILQTLLKEVDTDTKKVLTKNIQEDKKDKVEQYIKKQDNPKNYIPKENLAKNDKTVMTQTFENKMIGKENKKIKNLNNKSKISIDTIAKEDISQKIIQIKSDKKNIKKRTIINDIKEQKAQVSQTLQDNILHKIKTLKKSHVKNPENIQNITINDKLNNGFTKEIKETKNEPIVHKQELKTHIKTDNFKTEKNSETKNSLNQFSNDLKEKTQQYKPPLMKLKMALHPKNLGEVEVILIHRGNNLHVNIVSNANTMSLFTQNQSEFKNSLVNMGFTNLEMNFSDQGKNSRQNQQNNKKHNNSFEEFTNLENYESSLELIVPRYI